MSKADNYNFQTFLLSNSKTLYTLWVTATITIMTSCVWLDFRYFWREEKHFLLWMTLVCVLYRCRRLKVLLMHFLQSIWIFITTIIKFTLNLEKSKEIFSRFRQLTQKLIMLSFLLSVCLSGEDTLFFLQCKVLLLSYFIILISQGFFCCCIF